MILVVGSGPGWTESYLDLFVSPCKTDFISNILYYNNFQIDNQDIKVKSS